MIEFAFLVHIKDIHLMQKFAFECDHFVNIQCIVCVSISNNNG